MRSRGRSNFLRGPLVTTLTDMAHKMATPVEVAEQRLGAETVQRSRKEAAQLER